MFDQRWENALYEACFPVDLTDVYVGTPSRLAKRYRAVVALDKSSQDDPFAIVTDHYRLIRNEDVIDLGHEAFERVFGPEHRSCMTVYNVVMAKGRGSFFADFTSEGLECSIPIPTLDGSILEPDLEAKRHTLFLRVINSYNRTQAVRLEVGVCRWICRNGIIFGKQSIRFRDAHHKTKHQLMDQIAEKAERMTTDAIGSQVGTAYAIPLPNGMSVLEGVWQTLRLAIPLVDKQSRSASMWHDRCATLLETSQEYERHHGRTAFSVLQAASQWGQAHAQTSPIQRHSYERRCGEMLETLATARRWPVRDRNAHDQIGRVFDWANIMLASR